MTQPSGAQRARVRRLLAQDGADDTASGVAQAAGRMHGKLWTQLVPVIGQTGLQALLFRSVAVTRRDFPWLEREHVEDAARITAFLESQEAHLASEAAVALFGAFFELLTSLIGDRLTVQVLRGAWPTLQELASPESDQ